MKCILRLSRIAAVTGFGAVARGVYGVPVNAQAISNPHVQLTYLSPHNAELKSIAERVKKMASSGAVRSVPGPAQTPAQVRRAIRRVRRSHTALSTRRAGDSLLRTGR
jgi:hypothetical protein